MIGTGGWDWHNLLEPHSLAVLALFIGVILLLGLMHLSFRGAVVV